MTLCINGYKIIGRHRKQRYGKFLFKSIDHIKTWLSKDLPRIFSLAESSDFFVKNKWVLSF